MRIPFTFFSLFVIFALWTIYEIHKSKSQQQRKNDEFWEKERAANDVRRKPVNNLPYIIITNEIIPDITTDDNQILTLINQLSAMKELKILNLSGKTNTDLKMEYGPANLPFLTECDNNFINFCRVTNALGKTLADNNYISEAIQIYEFAIWSGSDVSSSYSELANLYLQTNRREDIKKLITQAETLDSLLKESIISKLNDCYEASHN